MCTHMQMHVVRLLHLLSEFEAGVHAHTKVQCTIGLKVVETSLQDGGHLDCVWGDEILERNPKLVAGNLFL